MSVEIQTVVQKGGGYCLTEVRAHDNENFEGLLKRFNRKVQQESILSEVRRREYYEKPSVKRKRKEAANRRKSSRTSRPRRVAKI